MARPGRGPTGPGLGRRRPDGPGRTPDLIPGTTLDVDPDHTLNHILDLGNDEQPMSTIPETGPNPVLRLDEVGLRFDEQPGPVIALDGVSLTVAPGEMVAITGRSGSGKSSLLNVAGGLTPVTSGTVAVGGNTLTGRSVKEVAALRRHHIGYVFQDLNLLPNLTAVENVSLPLELAGQDRRQAEAAASAALERVGLGAMGARFPNELSGGQRQRVAIARGVVGQRSLLLADEPTSALDDVTGEQILQLLRQQCDQGSAALLVTHEPSLAAWADRVIRLTDGAIESESIRPSSRVDLSDLAAQP